jgi:hypothetical protein
MAAVEITLKSITANGVLYTTDASSDTALFTSEDKSSETGYAKVADVTVDGTKATLAFADGYSTPVNITLGDGDGAVTCTTLSTSALPTGSTVALNGLTAATIGETTYSSTKAAEIAANGSVTLSDTVTNVTINGTKYESTAATVTSAGVATIAEGKDVTVTPSGSTTATKYTATKGSITIDKDGNATVEANETVTIGDGENAKAYSATDATGAQVFTADGKSTAVVDNIAKQPIADSKITLANDGTFTVDGTKLTNGTLSSNGQFYTASVKGNDKTRYFATPKYNGDVTIDLSSATVGYEIAAAGEKGSDVITTGRGDDVISVTVNDTVNAGKGADTIAIQGSAAGVVVVKNQNTNDDVVTGFTTGFDTTKADIVKLDNATGLAATSVKASDTANKDSLVLYTSSTKNSNVTLTDAVADSDKNVKIRLAVGSDAAKNYQFVANNDGGTYQDIDKNADAVYGMGTAAAGLTLKDADSVTAINLSGINNAKIGDTRTYGNIDVIDASASTTDNVLVTSGTMDSTIKAGSGKSSIWGGVSTVSGAAAADDYFELADKHDVATIFTGTANGDDTVKGYNGDQGDLIYSYDTTVSSVFEDIDQKTLTLGYSDGSSVELTNFMDGSEVNLYASAWGASVKAAVGETMAADKDTAIYYATKSATINVTDDFDGDKLWLYKEVAKDGYVNAKVNGRNTDLVIDARKRTSDMNIAGTSGNDTILAGQGTNALFGGAGTDALYGNESGQTTFYFGKDLAANTTVYVENKADKVVLYNVTESDIKSATYDDNAGSLTLTTNDGSTLTINKASTIDKTVSLSGTDYQFSSTGNALQKKA